jgi:hypothetical protein
MNQPLSAQGLTSIVGATLAVAQVKHESIFGRTGSDLCKQAAKKIVDCRMQQVCNIFFYK